MAKRKAVKAAQADQTVVDTAADAVEPMVIALAEQLGTVLGRVRRQTDGWMANESLRQQVSQIRDGATQLLERVNTAVRQGSQQAGAAARSSAAKLMPKKASAKKAKKAKKSASQRKARSGGVVDAPGKRHRRPPPDELFDKRLGEPMGKQMGQKHLKRRPRGHS